MMLNKKLLFEDLLYVRFLSREVRRKETAW